MTSVTTLTLNKDYQSVELGFIDVLYVEMIISLSGFIDVLFVEMIISIRGFIDVNRSEWWDLQRRRINSSIRIHEAIPR